MSFYAMLVSALTLLLLTSALIHLTWLRRDVFEGVGDALLSVCGLHRLEWLQSGVIEAFFRNLVHRSSPSSC